MSPQERLKWLIRSGDMRDTMQYRELLMLLGHFGDAEWGYIQSIDRDSTEMRGATRSYQRFSSVRSRALAIDGNAGPRTRRSVRERFCSCPDILPAGGSYWNRTYATTGDGLILWHDMDYTDADEQAIYLEAFHSWGEKSGTSGLRGRWYRDGDPRANIYSQVRTIDGPGGVLGWSYLPPANAPGTHDIEQRMDIADKSNLPELYAHELGHAIGHGHYPNSGGNRYLMNPYLQPGIRGPQGKEITLTQQMYGQADGGGGDPDPVDPTDPDDVEVIGRQRIGEVGARDLWMVHQLEPRE